jgi:glycerate kinase
MVIACDVQNPLTGPDGATAIYGPQKGATPEIAAHLEGCLCRYQDILLQQCGVDVQKIPGSGAAGGLGAGLVAFCKGHLQSGIDLILDVTRFDQRLKEADLVITGGESGYPDALASAGRPAHRTEVQGIPSSSLLAGAW